MVTIDGRDVYLGKYGTTVSREAYREQINKWRRTLKRSRGQAYATRHQSTVTEVIVAYVEFAAGYYRKDGKTTDEVRMIKAALKIVRTLDGRTRAAEFGPLALKACRQAMIEKHWCRTHINKQVDRVKRMFKWATENEMISGSRI